MRGFGRGSRAVFWQWEIEHLWMRQIAREIGWTLTFKGVKPRCGSVAAFSRLFGWEMRAVIGVTEIVGSG